MQPIHPRYLAPAEGMEVHFRRTSSEFREPMAPRSAMFFAGEEVAWMPKDWMPKEMA